jgi:hypothetical protein
MVIISFLICLKNRVFFNFKTTQQSKRYWKKLIEIYSNSKLFNFVINCFISGFSFMSLNLPIHFFCCSKKQHFYKKNFL